MVDENQVEQYIKAVKIKALKVEREQSTHKAVEDSPAWHQIALQTAFNQFCREKAATIQGSIGDKARLYDTLAKVAETLGINMPL